MKGRNAGSDMRWTLPSSQLLRIWRWPAVLGVLTIGGLQSALLGQGGIWWLLSWIALTIPLAVILVCVRALHAVAK